MFCKYCGNEVSGKFCPKCGKSTEEISAPAPEVKPEQPKKKKNNRLTIVLVTIICVALVAVGILSYIIISGQKKEDSSDKKEPTSSSEVKDKKDSGKSKKKADKKADKQNDIDISGIDDEMLGLYADAGILKKHIDYIPSDEIRGVIESALSGDYKAVTAEEYVDLFEGYLKRCCEAEGEEYNRDEQIAKFQYDDGSYVAINGDYVIDIGGEQESRVLSEYGVLIDCLQVYNTRTGDYYELNFEGFDLYYDKYGENYENFYFLLSKAVFFDGGVLYESVYADLKNYSVAFGFFGFIEAYTVYDENGDLAAVITEENYYDGELKPITEDKANEIYHELSDVLNV